MLHAPGLPSASPSPYPSHLITHQSSIVNSPIHPISLLVKPKLPPIIDASRIYSDSSPANLIFSPPLLLTISPLSSPPATCFSFLLLRSPRLVHLRSAFPTSQTLPPHPDAPPAGLRALSPSLLAPFRHHPQILIPGVDTRPASIPVISVSSQSNSTKAGWQDHSCDFSHTNPLLRQFAHLHRNHFCAFPDISSKLASRPVSLSATSARSHSTILLLTSLRIANDHPRL